MCRQAEGKIIDACKRCEPSTSLSGGEAGVGDLLIIECAGAYGFAMGSNYNSKPLAAEGLIVDGNPHLVRRRQTFEDLIRGESIPKLV